MDYITTPINKKSKTPLYMQIYQRLKDDISSGTLMGGQRLPPLRSYASALDVSITTVERAYSQLEVEGYINCKPQSGYYVNDLFHVKSLRPSSSVLHGGQGYAGIPDAYGSTSLFKSSRGIGLSGTVGGAGLQETSGGAGLPGTGKGIGVSGTVGDAGLQETSGNTGLTASDHVGPAAASGDGYIHDPSSFDFAKWKKCSNKVFNNDSELLFFEGDPQGERPLRLQIAKYVYRSRGVNCTPDQVVIGAGTQQITQQISRLLRTIGIGHVAVEEPGYMPVRSMFRDNGFAITPVGVADNGIIIEKLPANIRSAVYVSPSNQFPTGAMMPVGRRGELLLWAKANNSIIIEDDYDSELRYIGKPIPALCGLDHDGCAIYLGSFSTTLFPAIKISYMILPPDLARIFDEFKEQYTQTCSKAEQLTLAAFMQEGHYDRSLKKLRKTNAVKLRRAVEVLEREGRGMVKVISNMSGMSMLLEIGYGQDSGPETREHRDIQKYLMLLCRIAKEEGLIIHPLPGSTGAGQNGSNYMGSQNTAAGQSKAAGSQNKKKKGISFDPGSGPYGSNDTGDQSQGGFSSTLIFYYSHLPLEIIDDVLTRLMRRWRSI